MNYTCAQSALIALQTRAARTFETYESERLDRAMDEIVRNYDNDNLAPFQVRSARANAGKVLTDRRLLAPTDSLSRDNSTTTSAVGSGRDTDVAVQEPGFATFDLLHWLATTPDLNGAERVLLQDLAAGHDAQSLAERDDVPVARVRERISRARKSARAAYGAVALAA